MEVALSNGLRLRQVPTFCSRCGCEKVDGPFGRDPQRAAFMGLCVDCYSKEMAFREEAAEQQRLERLARGETPAERRYAAITLATPAWRDREKIREIYAEAKRLSLTTAIEYHVDHIYPIQSQFGCGLHVHQNLQIIEKTQNLSKRNKFPTFGSPAGVGIE